MILYSPGIFRGFSWYVVSDPALFVKTHSSQLYKDEFRGKISELVADLADPERPSPNDNM